MQQLAKWLCHKIVHAGEIVSIDFDYHEDQFLFKIKGADGELMNGMLPRDATGKIPQLGDFFVVYEDGYKSWSPRQAFMDGYARIDLTSKEPGS